MDGIESAGKVILLVEDNPDDIDLTLRALRMFNVANPLIIARDGVEALDYIFCREKHANRPPEEMPAVILLDLKLPRVDGLEVLKAIRENPATTFLPVVILTSSTEEADILNGYRLRANSYISKPVDFIKFARAIQQLHMYWLVLNEPPPTVP
jgi:two-component system, response regulator